MSELNFNFPVVRDINATRARHQNTLQKIEWRPSFLNELSDDDLFESIINQNHQYFSYYPAQHWRGQKAVKEIKGIVNRHVCSLIVDHMIDNNMPKSWATAYYLLHQHSIDNRMKSVSKLVYAELS
jgi:hypothetical protein